MPRPKPTKVHWGRKTLGGRKSSSVCGLARESTVMAMHSDGVTCQVCLRLITKYPHWKRITR
jgi:hypothetical protein